MSTFVLEKSGAERYLGLGRIWDSSMPLWFQSLRSGSSGNCLSFWTAKTRIFIDCGLRSQRLCREVMAEHGDGPQAIAAVVVSHAHTDHINYSALRVIEKARIPLWLPEPCAQQVFMKHSQGRPFDDLQVSVYDSRPFEVGDFEIEPIEVTHDPMFPTFGFIVRVHMNGREHRAAAVTDFREWRTVLKSLVDADFIYVEANHDPELLMLRPNPNSYYHMMNEHTGTLLCEVVRRSRAAPRAVMLGHLSEERNTSALALASVKARFQEDAVPMNFELCIAPRYRASDVIQIVP